MPSRCSVRNTRRAISPRLATRTDSNMPVDWSGHQGVAAQRTAEVRLRGARALQQRGQVDAGLDAHLVEHRDEVLRGHVAGGARGHRAAAQLAEARLEGL